MADRYGYRDGLGRLDLKRTGAGSMLVAVNAVRQRPLIAVLVCLCGFALLDRLTYRAAYDAGHMQGIVDSEPHRPKPADTSISLEEWPVRLIFPDDTSKDLKPHANIQLHFLDKDAP